jgi:hypothetical protein
LKSLLISLYERENCPLVIVSEAEYPLSEASETIRSSCYVKAQLRRGYGGEGETSEILFNLPLRKGELSLQ